MDSDGASNGPHTRRSAVCAQSQRLSPSETEQQEHNKPGTTLRAKQAQHNSNSTESSQQQQRSTSRIAEEQQHNSAAHHKQQHMYSTHSSQRRAHKEHAQRAQHTATTQSTASNACSGGREVMTDGVACHRGLLIKSICQGLKMHRFQHTHHHHTQKNAHTRQTTQHTRKGGT